MINREQLLSSAEYWFVFAQGDLYRLVIDYMEKEGINRTQLAVKLGCTKGYISQILRGEFNYTLKKHIELVLAIGMVPKISYQSLESVIASDRQPKRIRGKSRNTGNKRIAVKNRNTRRKISEL